MTLRISFGPTPTQTSSWRDVDPAADPGVDLPGGSHAVVQHPDTAATAAGVEVAR